MIVNGRILGVYEYWGIQRVGKSTVMVRDMLRLVSFHGFDFTDVLANFRVFIDGVRCGSSEWLMEEIMKIIAGKIRGKLVLFDELGQFLGARGWKEKYQTKLANSLWQFPKRNLIFMYSDNVGNSADVIIRDATWETIAPQFYSGENREGDYIVASVIKNYMAEIVRGIVIPGVYAYQRLFDSFEPIE